MRAQARFIGGLRSPRHGVAASAACAFVLLLFAARLSAQETAMPLRDSTAAALDTLTRARIPIPLAGSVNRDLSPLSIHDDSSIAFTDYRRLADIAAGLNGTTLLDFGATGNWDQLTIDGLDARSIQVALDGVPMNDAYSGGLNLILMPTEQIQRIEYLHDATSFAYGLNSAAGFINLMTKSRRALKPISRIRYFEGPYGESFIDGLVSQDVIRGLNVTAGAHHTTYGGRFFNSNYDQWNGRLKIRYNLNNSLNFIASENFNQTYLNLYGGISPTTPEALRFNQLSDSIVNGDSYEKTTRHDLIFQAIVRPPADSTGITTASVSYTSQLREYRDEENRFTPNSHSPNGIFIHDDQYSRRIGFRIDHQRTFGTNSLVLGAELQTLRYNVSWRPTIRSLFAIANIHQLEFLKLTGSLRLDDAQSHSKGGIGGDVAIAPIPSVEFFAGVSRSYRFPAAEELNAGPLMAQLPSDEPEEHDLAEGGIRLGKNSTVAIEARVFRRIVKGYIGLDSTTASGTVQPYEYTAHPRRVLRGGSIAGSFSIWCFLIEGSGEYLRVEDPLEPVNTLPEWNFSGGLYYRNAVANGHFDMKAGVHLRGFTSYLGRTFNTEYLVYVPGGNATMVPQAAVIDLVLMGRLGSATIHLVLQNLLDRQYVINNLYPMVDRSLRFGISWDFLN